MSRSSTAAIDIVSQLKTAIAHHQSGNLERAERHYRQILSDDPHHPDTLHLLGLVAHQRGNHEHAIALFERAIRANGHCAFYHNNLGAALKATGKYNEAIASYKKAIQLQPGYAEAVYNLGCLLLVMGRVSEAIEWYEKAIHIRPDYGDALCNLSAAYITLKRPDEAIDLCKQALSLNSNNAVALNNLGNAMMAKKRPQQAIGWYRKSIIAKGNNPEAHSNLGNALHDVGEQEQALASYRRALALNPKYGEAYTNMGIVLRGLGRLSEAADCYRKAIQLRPKDAEAYRNLGNIYNDLGLLNHAVTMYRRAIGCDAAANHTHVNLGIALEALGKTEAAIRSYSNALEIDANDAKAYSHLIHQLLDLCAWHQIDPLNEQLDRLTARALRNGEKPDEMPFLNLTRHADPSLNGEVARAWSNEIKRQFAGIHPFYPAGERKPSAKQKDARKIVIGYLSNNFKNHPTAHLVQGMFKHHDRTRFTVHCYSYGEDDKSSYRQNIMAASDRFVDLRTMSHVESARRIFNDGVDILVDLVGYMKDHRLGIPAMRPAPIQVRWLGMAGTTGADFFDYLIADAVVSPPQHACFYSEALVYMPDCYQINDNTQPLVDGDITRDRAGLPEKGVVFCSFSSRYKFDPVMFRLWMRILKQVDGSVLWMLGGPARAEENLKAFARSCGVRAHRLVFAKKISREAHLQRLTLADLALDTRLVNGALTTSEALWAGVPLITLQGAHFASRMSSSILSAAGLPELITHSLDEYEALAIRMASNPEQLLTMRYQLETNRLQMPLFNTRQFVRHLESAYLKMVDLYVAGEKPKPIRL